MAGSDERQIGWKSREEEGEMKSSRKKRQQGRGSDGRGGRGDGQRLRRVRKAVVANEAAIEEEKGNGNKRVEKQGSKGESRIEEAAALAFGVVEATTMALKRLRAAAIVVGYGKGSDYGITAGILRIASLIPSDSEDDAVGNSLRVRRELTEGIGSLPGCRKGVHWKKTETRRKIIGGSRNACRELGRS
ncbi:hypothetical protein BHM03_00050211 [Ensete ventricosum]|nr:hypothetical protein BHM03_00050211 [Ensete ventricosum]